MNSITKLKRLRLLTAIKIIDIIMAFSVAVHKLSLRISTYAWKLTWRVTKKNGYRDWTDMYRIVDK